jgi:ribosome-dependent ATPase
MLGKQIPYIALGFVSFLLMCLMAVAVFHVPVTGSFATLCLAALIFTLVATSMGLLASTMTNSQTAATFLVTVGTLIPATQYCGLLDPTSSLEGMGRRIGDIYPITYMFNISRGVFSKALGFAELHANILPMAVAAVVLALGAGVLLKKQEG